MNPKENSIHNNNDNDNDIQTQEPLHNVGRKNGQFTFGLTSKSIFKADSLINYIDHYGMNCQFTEYEWPGAPQPVGIKNTFICAQERLVGNSKKHRFLISIENGITVTENEGHDDIISDICAVVIKDTFTGKIFSNKDNVMATSVIIPNGHKFYPKMVQYPSKTGLGLNIKISQLIAKAYEIPEYEYDWMKGLCGISRKVFIHKALDSVWKNFMRETVMSKLRFVTGILPGGVNYQDYMSSMYTFTTRKFMTELLVGKIPKAILENVDLVTGPEFKGYCLAQGVADHLRLGVFPLRLVGNLPGPTIKMQHSKKYRNEHTLEIDVHEFNPLVQGEMNVLLVDYVRDTGESIKKMIELIEKAGGNVIYWVTVSSVPQHAKIAQRTLKKYPGGIVFDNDGCSRTVSVNN